MSCLKGFCHGIFCVSSWSRNEVQSIPSNVMSELVSLSLFLVCVTSTDLWEMKSFTPS